MFISIITLFPELFPGTLGASVIGKALKKNIWNINTVDLSKFTLNSRVDDKIYGGGAGMVIRPDVLGKAIDYTLDIHSDFSKSKIIYPSPSGKQFTRCDAKYLSQENNLIFICGRFEGIDQRVLERYHIDKFSLGNYVVSGGEVASMVIIETILRFIDGVVGKYKSVENDSFEEGDLVEYPVYTRPKIWNGLSVPDVLVSGHHENIKRWKKRESLNMTIEKEKKEKNI